MTLAACIGRPARRIVGVGALAGVLFVSGCAAQDGSQPAGSALPMIETTAPAPGTSDGAGAELIAEANVADCPVSDPRMQPVANGLPQLTLSCLGQGPDVDLAGIRGKPYVVNVWASWCGPCRDELPLMGELYRANQDQVGFLGIDMADDQIAALEMAATTNMSFPSVQDPESTIRAGLAVAGVPTTVFMRADGTIAGRTNIVTSKKELVALISQYLEVEI